jgi:hypothetical protein
MKLRYAIAVGAVSGIATTAATLIAASFFYVKMSKEEQEETMKVGLDTLTYRPQMKIVKK